MKKHFLSTVLLMIALKPPIAHAKGTSVFGDLLLWHASEETAAPWTNIIATPQTNVTNFTPKDVNFGWNAGFRGGLFYEPKREFWDSRLYWTYFSSTSSTHLCPTFNLDLPGFFSGYLSENDVVVGAVLDWQLSMNMFDYEASHAFKVGDSLTLRPSLGVKAGTINQTINADWNEVVLLATEKVVNNFIGVGPTFGLNAKWAMERSFSLIGDVSTAFMWGRWTLNDVYIGRNAALAPTTITTTMDNPLLGTLMIDTFVGLEWVHKESDLVVQLGYEMQYWANQLRMPTFQQLPVHGDLTLQGGTCRIHIGL